MNTSTPFYRLDVNVAKRLAFWTLTPSVAPAGKPVGGEVAGRRGSRPFRRLRFWTVAK